MNIIQELEEFISQASDARELKRAIAVKMTLSQVPTKEIQKHLGVSSSFVSKWKNQVLFHGVASLKLQHKGSYGSLTPSQRSQVRDWIGQQDFLRLSDLKRHLESKYSVVYESEQSYYNLLHEAKYTWKKTQKENPAKDEELVAKKNRKLPKKLLTGEKV
jgi:putative transposase